MAFHLTSEEIEALQTNQNQIYKLEPNKVYNIIDRKGINTKYGKKTILKDDKGKTFWNEFIIDYY